MQEYIICDKLNVKITQLTDINCVLWFQINISKN